MSSITYQRESLKEVKGDVQELLQLHYEEIGIYNDKISLDIMWEAYEKLDSVDVLHIITAREDSLLVGYYVCIVQPNLHYASTLFSANDILFIHPDYRKGFTGIKLIKEAEKQMKERGVQVMGIHFKTYAPFDKILERLGWDYTERLYTKYLGDS